MFIGRELELAALEDRFLSDRFEFGVVYGARRIGKTCLLRQFIKDKDAFYFQAKESNELDNRKAFSAMVNKTLGAPNTDVYPNYSKGFEALLKHAQGKPFVIVIDEVSYIAQSDKGFLSELQNNIDLKFKDTMVKLILVDSSITFMEDILTNKRGPLFQRCTFQVRLGKMLYSDALTFLEGISAEDKIKYLTVFGEYPYYLEMIDKSKTFEQNLQQLLFSRFGILVDAPYKVLPKASRDQGTYNTILKAISHGKRSSKDISEFLGKEPNYVANYLPKLVDNEIVERRESFSKNPKMNYYEIPDPLIRFWYRFVFDNREEILQDMGKVIYDEMREKIEMYMLTSFKNVAMSYLTEKNIKGKLGHYYETLREYRLVDSRSGFSIEFDGLAAGIGKEKNRLLAMKCNSQNEALSLDTVRDLIGELFYFSAEKCDIYLFSKPGFADDFLTLQNPSVHLISIKDMVG